MWHVLLSTIIGLGQLEPDSHPFPTMPCRSLRSATHSAALVTAATSLLRLSCRALLHDSGGAVLAGSREAYENILFLAKPLSTLVNDLVASLYPPQETTGPNRSSAPLFHTSCECMVSEFPSADGAA